MPAAVSQRTDFEKEVHGNWMPCSSRILEEARPGGRVVEPRSKGWLRWAGVVGDNRFPLLDVRAAGSILVDMRIILIPLALVAAAVIGTALLAAGGGPPTPIGPALAMNASLP
jgi:hypothetical protein